MSFFFLFMSQIWMLNPKLYSFDTRVRTTYRVLKCLIEGLVNWNQVLLSNLAPCTPRSCFTHLPLRLHTGFVLIYWSVRNSHVYALHPGWHYQLLIRISADVCTLQSRKVKYRDTDFSLCGHIWIFHQWLNRFSSTFIIDYLVRES